MHAGVREAKTMERPDAEEASPARLVHTYGPSLRSERSLLDYFKYWSRGGIAFARSRELGPMGNGPGGMSLAGEAATARVMSARGLANLLTEVQASSCPQAEVIIADSEWIMHDSSADADGVFHGVMRSDVGLQYAATWNGRLLAADPPVCRRQKAAHSHRARASTSSDQHNAAGGSVMVALDPAGGVSALIDKKGKTVEPPRLFRGDRLVNASNNSTEENLADSNLTQPVRERVDGPMVLDIQKDPIVLDCITLLHRTARQKCGADYVVKVMSATSHITAGLDVDMRVQFVGQGASVFHLVQCAFQIGKDVPDAKLLQEQEVRAPSSFLQASSTAASPATSKAVGPSDRQGQEALSAEPRALIAELDGFEKEFDNPSASDSSAPSTAKGEDKGKGMTEYEPMEEAEDDPSAYGPSASDSSVASDVKGEDTGKGKVEEDALEKEIGNQSISNSSATFNASDVEDDEFLQDNGLSLTLNMAVDVCSARDSSSTTPKESEALLFLQQHALGEKSLAKGNEWMRRSIPMALIEQVAEVPVEYSARELFPMCFPDAGSEVVRNQGNCGSCWAFAAASSVMANLCISGHGRAGHTVYSASDRYEVSVQHLMSCNPEKDGCAGGWALGADESLVQGIMKERDFPYQCGGGDPLQHFADGSSCQAAPWGANCPTGGDGFVPVAEWHYGGLKAVLGEEDMVITISSGSTLYAALEVYENFMLHHTNGGVYREAEGMLSGGHAVVILGYGILDSTKYWLIQNSWSREWGENGFAKFLRGSNFCDIEKDAYYFAASVEGGSPASPTPCRDFSSSGYGLDGQSILCSQAANHSVFGNMCTDVDYMTVVAGNCRVSCGECKETARLDPGALTVPPTPSLAPTPSPARGTKGSAERTALLGGHSTLLALALAALASHF
jgi:cathepsin B